ncbi:CCA tRNA nucleotidyltransferase [Dehalococcoides mccartyi]|uniref:PolyA polymerase, tRNA nucleotidyltransferase n=1 Tax=Dehalococcoides mccartyi (strain VS) TaxID=311424 RepID=D2BGQ9_DEHMV|nr:CCA tRNA nucleotidyltransferase [Dehalococcoides mccartyi]ACZ61509.1 polyA polymerase, tRNA nucleotidyltransferase [Dehalococcoides mccartyi VS]
MNAEKLRSFLKNRLPPEINRLILHAAERAASQNLYLYLAGGMVRDFLLDKTPKDADLVLTANAILFGQNLFEKTPYKVTLHHRFNNLSADINGFKLDITSARSEIYPVPGKLPEVLEGDIRADLFRRDFKINAMAISLSPQDFGHLADPYNGLTDLKQGKLSVLHPKSFQDDPSRIWRALRYSERLGFSISGDTLPLLLRDAHLIPLIGADRLWYEIECVFKEAKPENILLKAEETGVLRNSLPFAKADKWLADKFTEAREIYGENVSPEIYLCLLTAHMDSPQADSLITRLHLGKHLSACLKDCQYLAEHREELDMAALSPSRLYSLLAKCKKEALQAFYVSADNPLVRKNLLLFHERLSAVKPYLKGADLIALGFAPGPNIKTILTELLNLKLDGKVSSRIDEIDYVKRRLADDQT